MTFIALQSKTTLDFQENYLNLENLINSSKDNSFILSSELCLTNYSYENIKEASAFTQEVIPKLKNLSKSKTIALTMIEEIENKFYNTFFLFSKGEIIHKQSKCELFKLNDENRYFEAGNREKIQLFELNGLKIGVLICFELRFIEYWQKLRGADLILIPAMWGAKRKNNFEILSNALAIANQCFVIASNSANEECNKGSAIISPFGEKVSDDSSEVIEKEIDLKEIKLMRKYLDVGIK